MRVTPVLIPNTEVKPHSADDTRKGKVGRRQNRVLNKIFFSSTGVKPRSADDSPEWAEIACHAISEVAARTKRSICYTRDMNPVRSLGHGFNQSYNIDMKTGRTFITKLTKQSSLTETCF